MLKYEVRLGKDNFKKDKMVWSEKFLSPDLSVITGVTSPNYHLEKFNKLEASNSIINSDGALSIESNNVIREGFVVVKGKKYIVNTATTIDYSSVKNGKTIDYSYVNINGKYFYWGKIQGTIYSGFTIDNILNYKEGKVEEYLTVICGKNDPFIKIDAVYWIENGIVTIDGHEYIYDKNIDDNGILKFGENGEPLESSDITDCDEIIFKPYDSSNDYEEVTKFKLTKQEEITKNFEKITFSKYFYYVKYKEHYCSIKKKIDGDDYKFVCEIPKFVLEGGVEEYNLQPKEYELYFIGDVGDGTVEDLREVAYNAGKKVDKNHYTEHYVKLLNELKTISPFIYVEEDKAYFDVEYDVLNANDGNQIVVYLEDEHAPLKIGERLKLMNNGVGEHEILIYDSNDFNGVSNDKYAIYNGNKYKVKANICDKVIINGNEYPITYTNGKVVNKDCLVSIGSEKVPMKIKDASVNGGKLERYGKIINTSSNEAVTTIYDIKPYSGVTINGKDYIITDKSVNDETLYYVAIDLSPQYNFIIDEIRGSSLYICTPDINSTDFTDDFDRFISEAICKDVVDNQSNFELYIQNKIFGETEISKDLAFRKTETPVSSDDFYNLFDDIVIYVNNAYIHIPISLRMDVANNTLQDDIVTRDFYESEKEKAINPIVDMEKDVYMPKFISGYINNNGKFRPDIKYHGSNTIFNPIYQINLNFHFRTRDLLSWKVNDGYNNIEYCADKKITDSSTYLEDGSNDNWFITDFYPYRDILNSASTRAASADTLQSTSDLMGLLYFTNDDIFYQRSKVAKSFARLSFYDSTDPQTQSLLATSCVFIDEHKLFKTFIDNSRKNLYEYASFAEPEYSKNENGFIDPSPIYIAKTTSFTNSKTDITKLHKYNKISVNTEFFGSKKENEKKKKSYSAITDSKGVIIDESRRISSRLVIDNKHVSETSSEGFYLYIFREYAENLHPKPIYMKVEFNHAGIGKQIPFLIPMHWTGNTEHADRKAYNKMYPDHSLKLSNVKDIIELKNGIPLSYLYAQTYIPLYAVYDFKNKEYGYVFDNRYVTQDCNGVVNINLFEMKIKNESEDDIEENSQELIDIKKNQQIRAIINVNENQFDKKYFNYRTE